MIDICKKLRRMKERDLGVSGIWVIPVNPDGLKAADYIENAMEHMGYVLKIAYENIPDTKVREELRRHGYAALRGTK